MVIPEPQSQVQIYADQAPVRPATKSLLNVQRIPGGIGIKMLSVLKTKAVHLPG